MATRPGRVFSRDQLLDLAFPDDAEVYDRTIDSHIRNIRRKFAAASDLDPIRSVYGVGYAFDPDGRNSHAPGKFRLCILASHSLQSRSPVAR